VFLGEFGVRKTALNAVGARAAERWHWLRDVREEAEARGFPWAVWVYRGSGGFALADGEGTAIEAGTVAALGLKKKM
jgi:endoglucanase